MEALCHALVLKNDRHQMNIEQSRTQLFFPCVNRGITVINEMKYSNGS